MRTGATAIAVATLTMLAACAAQPDAPGGSTPDSGRALPSVSPPDTVPSDEDPAVIGEVPEDILEAIVADAARQTGLEPDEIEVVRGEAVTWNDGSLGCPEPGMMYTQALIDGYHVVVDADGQELDYRVDSGGGFRICENPDRPSG